MTKGEFLAKALEEHKNDGSIEAMVLYAYRVGREHGVKELGDAYTKVFQKITEKIENDRYSKYMNEKLFSNSVEEYGFYDIGNKKFIYHPDYSQSAGATFCSDEFSDYRENTETSLIDSILEDDETQDKNNDDLEL